MNKGRLKVTLILTCYNSRQNLKGTLDSILKQTYDNLEIIIIDGASTDVITGSGISSGGYPSRITAYMMP